MLIQATKYAVLIYISFSILNGNKEKNTPIFPDIESDSKMYQISACSGKCLTDNQTMTFDGCFNYCNKTLDHHILPLKKVFENYDLNLICRDDRRLVIKTNFNLKHPQAAYRVYTKTDHQSSKDIFIININKAFNAESAIVYLSNTSLFTISNLNSNTTYNVSVAVVHSDYRYSIVTRNKQFRTLKRGYKPKNIQTIEFHKFNIEDNNDNMHLKRTISWKPGDDMVCQYDILCHPSIYQDLTVEQIRDPEALYTYSVKQLKFDTLYYIGIRAKNSNDSSRESDLIWSNFTTPTCQEWYKNNLTICPPNAPQGLEVKQIHLTNNKFALNVTWDMPETYPDYYILRVLDLDELSLGAVSVKVNKTENSVFIPSIVINGSNYEVHLSAYSTGGNSSTMTDCSIERKLIVDSGNVFLLTTSIIGPIIGFGIMLLVIIILCHRREKLKRYEQRCRYFEELEKKAPADPKSSLNFATKTLPIPPSVETLSNFQLDLEEKLFFDDEMEIDRGSVQVFEILGEGAFGLVRRGIFKTNPNEEKPVAIKMLKDRPNIDDIRAFRREIEVMKSVGKHPNIVGIVGHHTKNPNDLLLLTEYCSKGNLLNFLRNEWQFLYKQAYNFHSYHSSTTPKIITSDEKQSENAFNFDVSLIEKEQSNYKSIEHDIDLVENLPINENNLNNYQTAIPKLIAFNKSYGYNQLCNSFCKCQVEIIQSQASTDNNSTTNSDTNIPRVTLNVQNCDCRTKNIQLPLSVENRSYYRNFENFNGKLTKIDEDTRQPLSTSDLFMIAKQIAMGMEFLSKNKVVHRDLAARNVLVCQDRTVKIADFGLSRDIYQENVYKKTGSGKLPIKWLALESLTHQVYTTQSDVWSFGILLYEIATLGGIPYPTIKTNRLMQLLKTGYRMEKPENCDQSLYDLMLSCWHVNPNERPNFSEICQILNDMINDLPNQKAANILLTENQKNCKNVDDETYLKPI